MTWKQNSCALKLGHDEPYELSYTLGSQIGVVEEKRRRVGVVEVEELSRRSVEGDQNGSDTAFMMLKANQTPQRS